MGIEKYVGSHISGNAFDRLVDQIKEVAKAESMGPLRPTWAELYPSQSWTRDDLDKFNALIDNSPGCQLQRAIESSPSFKLQQAIESSASFKLAMAEQDGIGAAYKSATALGSTTALDCAKNYVSPISETVTARWLPQAVSDMAKMATAPASVLADAIGATRISHEKAMMDAQSCAALSAKTPSNILAAGIDSHSAINATQHLGIMSAETSIADFTRQYKAMATIGDYVQQYKAMATVDDYARQYKAVATIGDHAQQYKAATVIPDFQQELKAISASLAWSASTAQHLPAAGNAAQLAMDEYSALQHRISGESYLLSPTHNLRNDLTALTGSTLFKQDSQLMDLVKDSIAGLNGPLSAMGITSAYNTTARNMSLALNIGTFDQLDVLLPTARHVANTAFDTAMYWQGVRNEACELRQRELDGDLPQEEISELSTDVYDYLALLRREDAEESKEKDRQLADKDRELAEKDRIIADLAAGAARLNQKVIEIERHNQERLEENKKNASLGGKCSPLDPVREHVLIEFDSRHAKAPFRSRRAAALNLIDCALAFAEKKKIVMSKDQAQTTIDAWLKDHGFKPKGQAKKDAEK